MSFSTSSWVTFNHSICKINGETDEAKVELLDPHLLQMVLTETVVADGDLDNINIVFIKQQKLLQLDTCIFFTGSCSPVTWS